MFAADLVHDLLAKPGQAGRRRKEIGLHHFAQHRTGHFSAGIKPIFRHIIDIVFSVSATQLLANNTLFFM